MWRSKMFFLEHHNFLSRVLYPLSIPYLNEPLRPSLLKEQKKEG